MKVTSEQLKQEDEQASMTTYSRDDGDGVEDGPCMRPLHGGFFRVVLPVPPRLLDGPEDFQSKGFKLLMKSWIESGSVELFCFGLAVLSSADSSSKNVWSSGRESNPRKIRVYVGEGVHGCRSVVIVVAFVTVVVVVVFAAFKSFNISIRFRCLEQTPNKEHPAVVSEAARGVCCL